MNSDPVISAVRGSRLLARSRTVLAAVSGGADSMAMLSALRASSGALGIRVVAAYFDHGLRDDTAAEREIVSSFCARREIAFYEGSGDVRTRARAAGESIEAAARALRYAFLESTADAVGADRIATAHTMSDQAETVMMRMRRGTGVRGMTGILPERGRVIRPLLGVSRADTEAHCRTHGIDFAIDPSNRDRRFARNRMRHDVLPAMRALDPGIDAALAALAESASRTLDDIRGVTDERLSTGLTRERSGIWVLQVSATDGLDETATQVLFADLLYGCLECPAEFTRAHYRTLHRMCARGYHSGREASLPGLSVRREHDALAFAVSMPTKRTLPRTPIVVPGRTRIDDHTTIVSSLVDSNETVGTDGGAVAYFSREALEFPLVARTPQPGDRMLPRGMHGHSKKISDILIDRKVPRRRRDQVLVVEDSAGIVWLVGEVLSERAHIGTHTETHAGGFVRVSVENE